MEFIIVTGMSGAGKSRAIDALEDIGFYCVDNIPPKLITKFAELCAQSAGKIDRVAVVLDIRGKDMFNDLFECLDELSSNNYNYKILFLDADDNTIIRRYKETRRKHPLLEQDGISTSQAIALEREKLATAREKADYVVDTSLLSVAQLKDRVTSLFLREENHGMVVNCVSFGYKYGIPSDADLVFDVRCLPNPFYVENLKYKTGLDEEVYQYVMGFEQSKKLVPKLTGLIDYLIPLYSVEGKSQLVIAIGCTGGKHRSVTFARIIYEHLQKSGVWCTISHRDISKN